MKFWHFTLAGLLLFPIIFTQSAVSDEQNFLKSFFNGSENPAFMQKIAYKINPSGLLGEDELKSAIAKSTLIVTGSNMDGPEKALLESAKVAYPFLRNTSSASDSDSTMEEINSGKYAIVALIGGPSQNRITKSLIESKALSETETVMEQFIAQSGQINGTLVVAFSDKRGYENAARESAKYSPLALVIPPEYVPAAATGISAILLALIDLARGMAENKLADKGKQGRKVGQNSINAFGINISEIAAVLMAAFILGISLSWQYFGPTPDFFLWIVINGFICVIAGVSHEVVHRIFAFIFKIKVEYALWPAGSVMTIVSAYLGNAFSVQGFLVEEIPENTKKWKVGLMKLSAPLFSAFVMVFFAILNVFFPNRIFQSIYSVSAVLAMLEMLPFRGLDGKDVKEWNVFVWAFFFLLVAGAYSVVTFLL